MSFSRKTSSVGLKVPGGPPPSGYMKRKTARQQRSSNKSIRASSSRRARSSEHWRSVSSRSARRRATHSQRARSHATLKRGRHLIDDIMDNQSQKPKGPFLHHTA